MKKFIRLFFLIFVIFVSTCIVNAESIDSVIAKCGINRSAVAVSVRDIKTGKVLYQLNEKHPMIPASTLKTITYTIAADTLGEDFKFSTELYTNKNNELYLKLAADPFLTTKDLKALFAKAVEEKIIEPEKIYIDDFVIDNNEWGEGWQWDDDLNPLMPKFSAYNLDKNLLTAKIEPAAKGTPANIYLTTFYPVTFMNLVMTGDDNNVTLSRQNHIAPDVITAEGTVKKAFTINFPVNYPKRYFILRLEESIKDAHMEYYNGFKQEKLSDTNVCITAKAEHDLSQAADEILKQSSNFAAESLFKIAGGKYATNTGTIDYALRMADAYFEKKGLNASDIRIVDASGVSKNNLMTADFMTAFLTIESDNHLLTEHLPKPSEGTLENRMLYFNDKLKAKTGTVSNVSAIAGYLTTQKGTTVAFDIMTNDSKSLPADKKMLEEYVLRAVYTNY